MLEGIKALFRLIKNLRLGFLVFLLSTILFFIILFPLNDLGDLISAQVSKASRNQVYVQFDGLNLSVIPFGLQMSNMHVETTTIPALKANEVTILPSIAGLLSSRPYGQVTALGLMKGEVFLGISSGGKGEKSAESAAIELSAKKLNLQELNNVLPLPFSMRGQANIDTKGKLYFTIKEVAPGMPPTMSLDDQPEMDLNIVLSKLEIPPPTVAIPNFGEIVLPEFKFKQIDLKGRLSDGAFIIEKGELGSAGDELQASIKGRVAITLQSMNGQIIPIIGAYNLDIDIKAQKPFLDKAGTYLSFLDAHKKAPGQYKFKVASSQWGLPPQITTLR